MANKKNPFGFAPLMKFKWDNDSNNKKSFNNRFADNDQYEPKNPYYRNSGIIESAPSLKPKRKK